MQRLLVSTVLAFGVLTLGPVTATPAHSSILLVNPSSAKKGEPVTLLFFWGHPYEHQMFDAESPVLLSARTPTGKMLTGLAAKMEEGKVAGAGGKKVTAFRLGFTPEERGDYLFILQAKPMWLEEEKKFFQDRVHVILHVQAQVGWDKPEAEPSLHQGMTPLTRPYGLLPGSVFQAVLTEGDKRGSGVAKPAANVLVEVERYNSRAPATLPADEFVTHTVKSDANGVFTATLPEPGWWVFTSELEDGTLPHLNKKFPLYRRTLLWVFVDEKAK